MHSDEPKRRSDDDDTHELPPMTRDTFDLGKLQTMADDEADAEWLRHPEAWHLH
jgi:hypothetical protein